MSRLFFGSIDLTVMLEAAKKKHSAYKRAGRKKHVYGNITLWLNEEPDNFGYAISMKLNPELNTKDESIYIGNLKEHLFMRGESLTDKDVSALQNDDDLPF